MYLYLFFNQGCGSGLTSIQIRTWNQKVMESGSNADPEPDPQQNFWRQFFSTFQKSKSKVKYTSSLYCSISKPFSYKNKIKVYFSLIFWPLDPDPISGFPIRIRIQIYKITEFGSNQDTNTDPDPQPWFTHKYFLCTMHWHKPTYFR
jgi:hypothetical protein